MGLGAEGPCMVLPSFGIIESSITIEGVIWSHAFFLWIQFVFGKMCNFVLTELDKFI